MKKYNVIWIDDEANKQDAFLDEAALEGLNLVPFTTNKEGMDELKNKLDFYDAVILDAKGFEKSIDEKAGLSGLMNSVKAINSLVKKIPYFIFSGYLDKDENESVRDMLSNEEIYTKGKDNQRLLSRIKEEADKQIDTQIRNENQSLFIALESYGYDDKKTILEILRSIKTGGNGLSDNLYFTPLRIILEQMFRKANSIGLLHDVCVQVKDNQVNLTESSRFMSGADTNHLGVRCNKVHFPKIISDSVQNILKITGAASHTSKVDVSKNIDIQEYRNSIKTPYLLFDILYKLADVLIWFYHYSKENSDSTLNKSHWQNIKSKR